MKWYSNNYRRHLVDMHIDDWDETFLSEFSPEEYIKNLKTAKVTNAMVYLQSHAGLCYFPTKAGVMHRAFAGKEDTMRRFIAMCHAEGIAVSGYYSLIYNTREHDRHPEWRMLYADGFSMRQHCNVDKSDKLLDFVSVKQTRYGLCCPSCEEYRKFVYDQIDEMLEYFTLDGFFFDMPFWAHTCYCDRCKAIFKNKFGYDMPRYIDTAKKKTDVLAHKYALMGEFIQSVTDYVRKKAPHLSIEHNFASGIAGDSNNGCGEEVAYACDFLGGDLYGGILNHSLACKFYKNITPNPPFDYMFSRCKPALRSHTLTKTEDEMKAEIMLTAAHHGATMVIDAIDPVGTFDTRVYDRIGKVFALQEMYEPYFKGEMAEDIGLYYSIKSRYNTVGEKRDNKTSAIGASRTLIGKHVPFGVTGNFHRLEGYKAIIAPMLGELEIEDADRLRSYVENGGILYLSGATSPAIIEKISGIKIIGRTKENNVYIAPTELGNGLFLDFNKKYPLPFDTTAPIAKTNGECEILATLTLPYTGPDTNNFASIHSDPPGVPTEYATVVRKRIGNGTLIWSALPIESEEIEEYGDIFYNILMDSLAGYPPSFASENADSSVELTLFKEETSMTLNLAVVEERAKSKIYSPFTVSVKTDVPPFAVKLLPKGEDIPFRYENGYVTFETKPLDIFDMYLIQL
jgi:hypothetical protein